MNLADAIRMAAQRAEESETEIKPMNSPTPKRGQSSSDAAEGSSAFAQGDAVCATSPGRTAETSEGAGASAGKKQAKTAPKARLAFDAVTSDPLHAPEPPYAHDHHSTVVRLELFLSPEQLRGLFHAVLNTQHSMMTLREAAQYLRIHPKTLEQMAKEGEIPALLIEGRWRLPKASIDEWLTLQTAGQGAQRNVA